MSASHDLTTLGVEDLLRLGGIRQTCASALTCLAHGLHVPCEQCAVEDLTAVVCRTCGATLPTMPATPSDAERPCASVEQFRSTGRVPFAAEAEAAWRKEREARARAERKRAKREREARERAEAEARAQEEAERDAREAAERAEEDARRAEEEREAHEHAGRARVRSRGTSFAAMLVGAVMVWWSPLNALRVPGWVEPGWEWTVGYLALCVVVWNVAAASIPQMMRPSPFHWAMVSMGWPAFGALASVIAASPLPMSGLLTGTARVLLVALFLFLAGLVGVAMASSKGLGRASTIALASVVACIAWLSLVLVSAPGGARGMLVGFPALTAAAFAMRACVAALHDEAPVGVPKGFRGLRSPWVWLGLVMTAVMNFAVFAAPFSSASLSPSPAALEAPRPAWVWPPALPFAVPAAQAVRQASGSVKDPLGDPRRRASAISMLNIAFRAVDRHGRYPLDGRLTDVPDAEWAFDTIRRFPDPPSGNRYIARTLLYRGLPLARKPGSEAAAVAVLERGRAADRSDEEVVNHLAFAELKAGRYLAAREHLLEALMLAPEYSAAWANLGELTAVSSIGSHEDADNAARMLVMAYWCSDSRPRALSYLRRQAARRDIGTTYAGALGTALARITGDASSARPPAAP